MTLTRRRFLMTSTAAAGLAVAGPRLAFADGVNAVSQGLSNLFSAVSLPDRTMRLTGVVGQEAQFERVLTQTYFNGPGLDDDRLAPGDFQPVEVSLAIEDRTKTKTKARTKTKTKTKTRTKTKTKSKFELSAGGIDLNALAVEEVKYIDRISGENFDVIDHLLRGDTRQDWDGTANILLHPPERYGDTLRAELDEVLAFQAELSSRDGAVRDTAAARLIEVEEQADDIITPFFDSFVDEAGIPSGLLRLVSLMETAGHFIVAPYKEEFQRPRPFLVDTAIDPAIAVPHHDSYPSGHALQAHLIAFALCDVMGDLPGHCIEFMQTAERIAENREFGGLHYRSDSEAGALIARHVFPLLKVKFSDVFADAVAAIHARLGPDCDLDARHVVEGAVAPPTDAGLWYKRAIGADNLPVIDESDPRPTVALIDTAIDLTHPSLRRGLADYGTHDGLVTGSIVPQLDRFNPDHPSPAEEAVAFGASGTGHGTAMAGIIAGQDIVDGQVRGLAPECNIRAARVTTLMADSHANRMSLATIMFEMTLASITPPRVMLIGPPIARPAPDPDGTPAFMTISDFEKLCVENPDLPQSLNDYSDLADADFVARWKGPVSLYKTFTRPPCDPFALAVWATSLRLPVVIPAGNDGTGKPSYPGSPADYTEMFATLRHPFAAQFAMLQLLEVIGYDIDTVAGSTPTEVLRNATPDLARNAIGTMQKMADQAPEATADLMAQGDPFAGTGIIVVGAGVPDDPAIYDKASGVTQTPLTRAVYSQFGPGLTLLAPSDGDDVIRQGCAPWQADLPQYHRPVPAPDIWGHGGFAPDPRSLYATAAQRQGFGGTSAASAIVAGVIARLPPSAAPAFDGGPRTPLDGPMRRSAFMETYVANEQGRTGWLRVAAPEEAE